MLLPPTASVYINASEDGLLHDHDARLEKLAPHAPTSRYQHHRTGKDNADAHLKFDGRRRKRVLVKIIGE